MADPFPTIPLLLSRSVRIAPRTSELGTLAKFASHVSDSSLRDIEALRAKASQLRVVDTTGNTPYDEKRQQQRLQYVAAISLLRQLGIHHNMTSFTYTPAYFNRIQLAETNLVHTTEYWRDECYTLYSYALHEYRLALQLWRRQAQNCIDSITTDNINTHLSARFPGATEEDLLAVASSTQKACNAITRCIRMYDEHMADGDDVSVLAQSGDLVHLTAFKLYLQAATHETIVIVSEFKSVDPTITTEETEKHAYYAQYIAKKYEKLQTISPTWVPPDIQVTYTALVTQSASFWKSFAQILASRNCLSLLQEYTKLRDDGLTKARCDLNKSLTDNSHQHIHMPIDRLNAEFDTIGGLLVHSETSQAYLSHDNRAVGMYFAGIALKLSETYNMYTSVFTRKPPGVSKRYAIDQMAFHFTRYTKEAFAADIRSFQNHTMAACGRLHYILDAVQTLNASNTTGVPHGVSTSNDGNVDLIGIVSPTHTFDLHDHDPGFLRAQIARGYKRILAPLTLYDMGVIDERMRWFLVLRQSAADGMTLDEVVKRFDGDTFDAAVACYSDMLELVQ